MEIRAKEGDRWELAVNGEVDADNCDELLAAVLNTTSQSGPLYLDLSELAFIDSSGISALLKIKSELETRGHTLQLQAPTESVHRVLEITGLLEAFGLQRTGT